MEFSALRPLPLRTKKSSNRTRTHPPGHSVREFWRAERFTWLVRQDPIPRREKSPENFEDEVRQTLQNIEVTLKAAGYSFEDAVAVQVFLTDMELFQRMNAVYTPFFPEPRPVRTTVGVAKLVGTAKIEITLTAWKKQ